ncbi:MAG: DivIVA domain-containing protein [Coriobacteriales bacterium]|nr:DivIVA domain-containing protein [Actinomycetes bacterium]
MKLTPLDIHHKEFSRSIRGYNEAEVDEFLDEVADELERLFKENIDLSERIEAAEEKVKGYQEMERTLHNTMVSAQKSAEDIVAAARQEAETILKDAEVKAKDIIHNALTQKQKTQNDLMRIKQAEEDFRKQFKALLESHMRALAEIPLPEDVTVLTGEANGEVIGEVQVATPRPRASVEEGTVPPASSTYKEAVASQLTAEPEPRREPAREEPLPQEPPSPGFVQGLQLGEIAPPDLPDEEPTLDVPEFTIDFGSVGERDDDIDIEEID